MSCGYTPPKYCKLPMCMVCQGFCQANTNEPDQTVASHIGPANAPSVSRDDIIIKKFPRSEYDRLLAYIQSGANLGSQQDSRPKDYSRSDSEFVTAQDINGLLKALNALNNAKPLSDKKRDDIIYASDFQLIFNAINTAKTDYDACNTCNVGCDIQCRTCITCNSCKDRSCSDSD